MLQLQLNTETSKETVYISDESQISRLRDLSLYKGKKPIATRNNHVLMHFV